MGLEMVFSFQLWVWHWYFSIFRFLRLAIMGFGFISNIFALGLAVMSLGFLSIFGLGVHCTLLLPLNTSDFLLV
jgi:hypothetical protein